MIISLVVHRYQNLIS